MKRPLLVASSCLALFLAGCDDDPLPPHDLDVPPPRPAVSELVASAMASATSSAPSTDAPVSFDALAGEWEGSYEAKKGTVGMPPGVADPARAKDDGKIAAGAGKVTLTVLPNGDVSGKSTGALGTATIRGKVDGKMLKGSFFPDNPSVPNAMTGVIVGPIRNNEIQAELRVAGGDAMLVRQANFTLRRK